MSVESKNFVAESMEEGEEYYVYRSANFSIKFLGTFGTLEEAIEMYNTVPLIRAAGIYYKDKNGAIKNLKFYGVPNYNSRFFEEASKEAIKSRKFSTPPAPIESIPHNNNVDSKIIQQEENNKPFNPFLEICKEIQNEFYSDKSKIDKACKFPIPYTYSNRK
jgi:hypothetical protein